MNKTREKYSEKYSKLTECLTVSCCLLLTACQTAPKAPDRQVVQVQVPVPCVDASTPGAPAVSTKAQLAALPDDTLVLTLAKERLQLSAWAAEVGPVLEGCRVLQSGGQ